MLPTCAAGDPRFTLDEAGAARMFADCDLRAIEAPLIVNDRVRVFANENDFLLRAADVAWLRERLGERARIFPAAGHLGNLHRKATHAVIQSVVAECARVTARPMRPE